MSAAEQQRADLRRAAAYIGSNNSEDSCISGSEADRIAATLLAVEAGARGEPVATFRCWTEPSSTRPQGRQFYEMNLLPAGNALPDGEYQLYATPARFTRAAQDVLSERHRQDQKWGGPEHDDEHSVAQWVELIQDYAGWARVMAGMDSHDKARRRLIQVAALALAAAESLDRAAPAQDAP